jgi:dethiobiotin synthetase
VRGFFVTATGTEIGKTVVAAAIANAARRAGAGVAVFKPAVSGLVDYPLAPEGWENAPRLPDHALLRLAAGSRQGDDEITPYRFAPPVSPHLAAELAGARIDPDLLRGAALAATQSADLVVCEGVGGFLVPLTAEYLVRDLARDLALPVVIVAEPGLGTINHTLLTIESVRAAGLEVASVVLNLWPAKPSPMEGSNLETIERMGSVPVQTLPKLELSAPDSWPALAPPAPAPPAQCAA